MARRFLAGQAEQNIQYTEITYTPHIHYKICGLDGRAQLDALNRARQWAKDTHDIECGFIFMPFSWSSAVLRPALSSV